MSKEPGARGCHQVARPHRADCIIRPTPGVEGKALTHEVSFGKTMLRISFSKPLPSIRSASFATRYDAALESHATPFGRFRIHPEMPTTTRVSFPPLFMFFVALIPLSTPSSNGSPSFPRVSCRRASTP